MSPSIRPAVSLLRKARTNHRLHAALELDVHYRKFLRSHTPQSLRRILRPSAPSQLLRRPGILATFRLDRMRRPSWVAKVGRFLEHA